MTRLVKYLLNNRKHGTYWNSTRDTATCVEAFADYVQAAGETEPDMFVEVWLDGAKLKEVQITKENLFTYDNKFVLSVADVKNGAHEIELRRRGKGVGLSRASAPDHPPNRRARGCQLADHGGLLVG